MSYGAVTPAEPVPRFVQEPEPEYVRSYEEPWSASNQEEEEEPWNQSQIRRTATKKSPRSHRLRSWYGLRDPSDPR